MRWYAGYPNNGAYIDEIRSLSAKTVQFCAKAALGDRQFSACLRIRRRL
jgi:hypothetical protein